MRTHTNDFKTEIKKIGREIKGKIIYYNNYNFITEAGDNILTEGNMQLITEQANYSDPIQINEDDIFSISITKNGNLLQSLMKQFNFEAKIELNLGTVVNPQFGLLVDKEENEYEYLDYGNYYIYSKEYNIDMNTWSYVCYDKMLFSMIKYKELSNITYPITIKQYLINLCNKIGLEFEDTNFINYNQLIYKDVFENRDITYRDIFDEISKIAGGNLLINDDNKIEMCYPTTTNDTINDEYLKDTNVKVNKQIGPVNSVAIYDSENDIEYIAEDSQSIKQYGLTRITITDNLIALNGEAQDMADNIFNQLEGLTYYENDFTTTGVCYYDFLDLFIVQARGQTYPCLLLNNEITISQGIEEHIFTEELEELKTQTNQYTTSVLSNKQASFKIDEQNGKIESRVEKDGVISAINQSAEEIQIQANKISLEGKEINLTSDNIIINSVNFSVDEDGKITATGGDIAGFEIDGTDGFSYKIYAPYDYTNDDLTRIQAIITGQVSPTTEDLERYDLDNSGTIGATDYVRILWYIREGINTTNYGKFEISLPKENKLSSARTGYVNADDELVSGFNYTDVISENLKLTAEGSETIVAKGSTGNITCVSLTQTSKEENKKNFEKLTNAKDILNQVDIYKYNFKDEDDNVKKSIGFVIGDDFNYSQEITSENNDGANIYSMVSVLWQVVKEQQEEINELKEMIKSGKY